jgi:hypothetical protein
VGDELAQGAELSPCREPRRLWAPLGAPSYFPRFFLPALAFLAFFFCFVLFLALAFEQPLTEIVVH